MDIYIPTPGRYIVFTEDSNVICPLQVKLKDAITRGITLRALQIEKGDWYQLRSLSSASIDSLEQLATFSLHWGMQNRLWLKERLLENFPATTRISSLTTVTRVINLQGAVEVKTEVEAEQLRKELLGISRSKQGKRWASLDLSRE